MSGFVTKYVLYQTGRTGGTEMEAKKVMDKVKAPKVDANARDIAKTMISAGFCHMPVVDKDDVIVGIVSEHDILKKLQDGEDIDKITAKDIMHTEVVTVPDDASLESVIEVMTTQFMISLPVVKANGKLAGVISRKNILHNLIDHEYQDYFKTIP